MAEEPPRFTPRTLVAQALGPLMGKGLRYIIMDSWEAGMQNWTEDMPGEFRKRRGYDPTPYLPVLAGRIVVLEGRRVAGLPVPVGAHQHPGARRNATVLLFEAQQALLREEKVRVLGKIPGQTFGQKARLRADGPPTKAADGRCLTGSHAP